MKKPAKVFIGRLDFMLHFNAAAEKTFQNPYKLLMQEGTPDAKAAREAFVKSVEGVFGKQTKLTPQELHGRLMATCRNGTNTADFTRMNQIYAVEQEIPKLKDYLKSGRPTL